jgi:hypothetical protein
VFTVCGRIDEMTYQQAQDALKAGLLAKRKKWPDSTWLSSTSEDQFVRVRTQKPFEHAGEYAIYEPTQEDLDATDWLCRPS